MKYILSLFIDAFKAWNKDKSPMLGAALSYYTVFSLAPLMLVIIGVLGLVFGKEAVEGQIYLQLNGFLGKDGAKMVEDMIKGASKPSSGIISIIIGSLLLLLSASGVFGQLKQALNIIMKVEPKPGRGIFGLLRERFLSFAMLGVIAFLLAVSLVASTAIGVISAYFTSFIPLSPFLLETINFVISFTILLFLFAFIYKILPDATLPWKPILIGAAVTSFLFSAGKTAIGIYIGNSAASSSYGAASSLIVILLWVYYAAQILFFGAEFVKVLASSQGIQIKPSKFGQLVTPANAVVPVPVKSDPVRATASLFAYMLKGFTKTLIEQKNSASNESRPTKKLTKKRNRSTKGQRREVRR